MTTKPDQPDKRLRFAIYARYSSEMQNELSIADQIATCRKAVAERGGVVVGEFHDDALSGWSLDRAGLTELRSFASRNKCDAIMMWKFDRLMRDHDQTVVVKLLLRKEYGVKLYCVEGFSEDDDDSPYTAMMEQLLAVFSAFYSKNLSIDTKRAKRLRAERGEYNGSEAPIGYILVTKAEATAERPEGLYIQPRLAVIVRRAFKLYASGGYSDAAIAAWMNQQPAVKSYRAGLKPIDKEFVRWMLQNKVYTGRVSHSDTQYNGGLGQGRKGNRRKKEWFDGKHQGFVSDSVFNRCEEVRGGLARHRKTASVMHTYVLHDRVFCAHCIASKPQGVADANYGKMRPTHITGTGLSYYRCLARDRGYGKCDQSYINEEDLNRQVVEFLSTVEIPEGFRDRVEHEVQSKVEYEAAFKRMEEIREIIKRIDISWENGFLERETYLQKRQQLQQELEALRPIDFDELTEAADLLTHFRSYWEQCEQVESPAEARRQLITKIVERVFVYDRDLVGVVLHGNYAVILNENLKAPAQIADALVAMLSARYNSASAFSQCGADGHQPVLCILFVLSRRYVLFGLVRDLESYLQETRQLPSPTQPKFQRHNPTNPTNLLSAVSSQPATTGGISRPFSFTSQTHLQLTSTSTATSIRFC